MRRRLQGLVLTALPALLAAGAAAGQEASFLEYAHEDPAKIMTAESCGECHIQEFEVWRSTPHASGFKTLHRKEQAENIAAKLGFRLIKRQSFCYSCHYTGVLDDEQVKVVSGVSCESCHGAARDWMDVHNSYGEGRDAATETAEHRAMRIEASRRNGMRRPSDLYPVVANCFGCHTVPNERLVNVGGHTTGTADFEFGARSQGEIRHNFLASSLAGGDPDNREAGVERRRLMYVVGRAVDLEYSLRGLAEAAEDGIYAKAMSRRVRSALAEVRAVSRAAPIPEVDAMIAAVKGAKVVAGRRAELEALADRIGAATRAFLDRASGVQLAALDPLVQGLGDSLSPDDAEEPVAETVRVATAGPEPGVATGAQPPRDAAAGPAPGPPADAIGDSGGRPSSVAAPSSPAGPQVVGGVNTRLRPRSRFRTVGPGNCSGCHEEQNSWWFDHAHSRSADPFFDGAAKNLQIAQLYGVSPSAMTRGDKVCMDCHGTIISGKERRDVLDGVSCESCHGPAADWLEPHKQGEGRDRPAFARSLTQGKLDLRDLETRAGICTDCHYITDSRLISSGHPSGRDFDYVKGMVEIRHWRSGPAPAAAIASAFGGALASRGAVPDVAVAELPPLTGAGSQGAVTKPGQPGQPGQSVEPGGRVGDSPTPETYGEVVSRIERVDRERADATAAPLAPRPVGPVGRSSFAVPDSVSGPLDLPPFPAIDDGDTVEDILLLLQQRLRLLHQKAGGGKR